MLTRSTSRRTFLVGLAAIGAVGSAAACTSEAPEPVPLETADATPDDAQIASEVQLLALYSVVLRAFPEFSSQLTPIADHHREHARALGLPGEPTVPEVQAPPTSRQALRALIAAEEQATRERAEGCSAATNPERVRILSLIAASEASHALWLSRVESETS